MKMKQHTDWTDRLRDELRDAEIRPSEGGWERLQRDLEAADRTAVPIPATPRRNFWRIYGARIAAAAAVVLLGVVAGELLWHPDDRVPGEIAAPELAAERPHGEESLRDAVARASGWSQTPSEENLVARAASRDANPDGENPAGEGPEHSAGVRLAMVAAVPAAPAESGSVAADESVAETAPAAQNKSVAQCKSASGNESAADNTADNTPVAENQAAAQSKTAAGGDPAAQRAKKNSQPAARTAAFEADPLDGKTPRRSRASLSLFAGGGASGSSNLQNTPLRSYSVVTNDAAVSIVGNGNNLSPMPRRDYDESSFRHHLPLSFGLTVRKELPRGFSLESGLVYTLLRSDVRLRYSSDDVSQKLHLLGIPLRMNWRFAERGRFSAYLGAGGMAEKCVSAKFGSETVDEPEWQWSLLAAVGAQYALVDQVGLYFEPEASWHLTDTGLRTSRTDAPLSLTLRLGVRVLF